MAFAEDANEFLDENDFAVAATLEGVPVTVILDQGFVGDEDGSVPVVLGTFAELGSAVRGDTVVIDSTSYTLREDAKNDSSQVTTMLEMKLV